MMNYDALMSPAAKKMRPSGIRKFFDLASEMPDCISLGVGEPDFNTPWQIRDTAISSLESGKTKYTANAGLLPLRKEISNYLSRRFSLTYEPDEILVTVGGSEAIDLAIRALVSPLDEVLIPEPCFVCYEPITTLTGGVPVSIPTSEENGFRVTADMIRNAITPKTKLLILPYPNNPTGAVLSKEELEEIAGVLEGTDIFILTDEIYAELYYGDAPYFSVANIESMKERTVYVNGFSKSYAMTGWRLGYAAGPKPVIDLMKKIHQSCIMCAPTMSQYAAITALRSGDEDIERMRDEYNMRRRYIVKRLNAMGLPTFDPKGAFYVFPHVSVTGYSSDEFCEKLLKEKHVAIIPGNAFGSAGEGYARISYAYSLKHLETALDRMEEFLKEHH